MKNNHFKNKKNLILCIFAIFLIFCFPINAFAVVCGSSAVGISILEGLLYLAYFVLLIMTILSITLLPNSLIKGINWIVAIGSIIIFNPSGFFGLDYNNPYCATLALKVFAVYVWAIANMIITFKMKPNIIFYINEEDKEGIESLISKKQNINDSINHLKWTPIFYAIFYNKKEITEFLLSKGANINLLDINKKSPLDYAQNNEIKQILLSHGAKSGKDLK